MVSIPDHHYRPTRGSDLRCHCAVIGHDGHLSPRALEIGMQISAVQFRTLDQNAVDPGESSELSLRRRCGRRGTVRMRSQLYWFVVQVDAFVSCGVRHRPSNRATGAIAAYRCG